MRIRRLSAGRIVGIVLLVLLLVVAFAVPLLHRSVGPVFPGPLDSPGTLQLLSQMFVIGALAISLYLLVGVTGMLSLGHGLYFALSAYATVILSNTTPLPFAVCALLAILLSTLVGFVVSSLSLRSTGVAYSMITLAFAELLAIGVARGFFASGSDQGVSLDFEKTPEPLRGLANMPNVYWLCLVGLILVFLVVWFAEKHTNIGRVWVSIRENELRTESIGFNAYGYKVSAAVLASFLAAVCGVLYAIVTGGANPDIASVMYSLGLILMVILGGRGYVWGALLGGLLYTYLTLRLPSFATADVVDAVGPIAGIPLSQPEFVLGVVFVIIILAAPNGLGGGIASLAGVIRRARARSAAKPVSAKEDQA